MSGTAEGCVKGKTFTAGELVKVTKVPYHSLNYWDKAEVLSPSVTMADGSHTNRIYNFSDAVALVVVCTIRKSGSELQCLRTVAKFLQKQTFENCSERAYLVLTGNGEPEISEDCQSMASKVEGWFQSSQDKPFTLFPIGRYVEAIADRSRSLNCSASRKAMMAVH